jgi:predicted DNA-binding ribbon-helix-helix protein
VANKVDQNQGENVMCQIFAGQDPATYEYETRSLRLNGQSTSIRLERMFWNVLTDIAEAQELSTPLFLSRLHSEVLELHGEARNFTSFLRCTCLVDLGRTAQEAPAARLAAE